MDIHGFFSLKIVLEIVFEYLVACLPAQAGDGDEKASRVLRSAPIRRNICADGERFILALQVASFCIFSEINLNFFHSEFQ